MKNPLKTIWQRLTCKHQWDKGRQIGWDKYWKCLKCGAEKIDYRYDYPLPNNN